MWKAIRPGTKDSTRERGLEHLVQLNEDYFGLSERTKGSDRDLSTATWEHLSGLFDTAVSIKGVTSPVFASKLCHFIFPNAFPVADRAAFGVAGNREGCWACWKDLWLECRARQELTEILRSVIGEPVTPGYPWATKITELCLVGHRVAH